MLSRLASPLPLMQQIHRSIYNVRLFMEATWRGHCVMVEAYRTARRAWITTSIDVLLDGNRILMTGGKFRFTGTCSELFRQADGEHKIELSWGSSFWGISFPFTVRIDSVEICSGRVRAARWYLEWLLYVVAALAVLVLYGSHETAQQPNEPNGDSTPRQLR